MKRPRWTRAIIGATGLCLAGTLQAQDTESTCREMYPSPRTGDFVVLSMRNPASPDTNTIRLAVVGTEEAGGSTHYWIELRGTRAAPTGSRQVVAQILVPGYPFDVEEIQGYIVKIPNRPPMRMPKETIQEMGEVGTESYLGWQEECEAAEDLGVEQLTVPAGSFRARHLRMSGDPGGEIWISDQVPFGMVRVVQTDGTTMELVAQGTDATSSITEEPIEFPPPGGPQ